jgi:hypothetical protein
MRVIGRYLGPKKHGVISSVIQVETEHGSHRDIMVRWDGSPGSMMVDPVYLKREPRVPIENREKLEKWLAE